MINYQPQLLSRISEPSTVSMDSLKMNFLVKMVIFHFYTCITTGFLQGINEFSPRHPILASNSRRTSEICIRRIRRLGVGQVLNLWMSKSIYSSFHRFIGFMFFCWKSLDAHWFFSCYIIVGLHLSFFLYIQPLGISSTNMHRAAHRKLIRTELHPRPFQGGKNLFPHRRTWLQCHWRHRSNLENNWVFWKCWVVKSSVWNGTGYLVLSTSLWWCPNSPHVNQIFCVVGGRRGGGIYTYICLYRPLFSMPSDCAPSGQTAQRDWFRRGLYSPSGQAWRLTIS